MEMIPKINITDRASYVEAFTIAVDAVNLSKYANMVKTREYFQNKRIILLSIIPDDYDASFIDLLIKIREKMDISDINITTSDCACYNDQPAWCDEELEYLNEDNENLLKTYSCSIGLLKGYDAKTYEKTRKTLENHVKHYMIYLSGEARSNPRYFSIEKFFAEKFPSGLDKPVYLHGCPRKQFKLIPNLHNINVVGIITAQHITKAVYSGNPHYKRETRITKEWQKLLDESI